MTRAFVILAVVQLLFAYSRHLPKGSHESPFDDVLWRSTQGLEQNEAGITRRQKMLGDLVDKNLLGKSRAEVITLLGEPSTKMDPDGAGPALSYPTGFERDSYIRIDSEWLLIYFNSAGKVIRYEIGVD